MKHDSSAPPISGNTFLLAARDLSAFRGRLGRLGFLRESVAWIIALQAIDLMMPRSPGIPPSPLVAIIGGAVVWIWLSTMIRRFHDFSIPGWITTTFLVMCAWMAVTAGISSALAFPVLMGVFMPGSGMKNAYGEPPAPLFRKRATPASA